MRLLSVLSLSALTFSSAYADQTLHNLSKDICEAQKTSFINNIQSNSSQLFDAQAKLFEIYGPKISSEEIRPLLEELKLAESKANEFELSQNELDELKELKKLKADEANFITSEDEERIAHLLMLEKEASKQALEDLNINKGVSSKDQEHSLLFSEKDKTELNQLLEKKKRVESKITISEKRKLESLRKSKELARLGSEMRSAQDLVDLKVNKTLSQNNKNLLGAFSESDQKELDKLEQKMSNGEAGLYQELTDLSRQRLAELSEKAQKDNERKKDLAQKKLNLNNAIRSAVQKSVESYKLKGNPSDYVPGEYGFKKGEYPNAAFLQVSSFEVENQNQKTSYDLKTKTFEDAPVSIEIGNKSYLDSSVGKFSLEGSEDNISIGIFPNHHKVESGLNTYLNNQLASFNANDVKKVYADFKMSQNLIEGEGLNKGYRLVIEKQDGSTELYPSQHVSLDEISLSFIPVECKDILSNDNNSEEKKSKLAKVYDNMKGKVKNSFGKVKDKTKGLFNKVFKKRSGSVNE